MVRESAAPLATTVAHIPRHRARSPDILPQVRDHLRAVHHQALRRPSAAVVVLEPDDVVLAGVGAAAAPRRSPAPRRARWRSGASRPAARRRTRPSARPSRRRRACRSPCPGPPPSARSGARASGTTAGGAGCTWIRLTLNPSPSSRTCQEPQGRSSLSRDTASCWIMHPLRSAGPHSEVGSGHCDSCDGGPHRVRDRSVFRARSDSGIRCSAQAGARAGRPRGRPRPPGRRAGRRPRAAASSGTLRLTRASAIGPSSWWRARGADEADDLLAEQQVGADARAAGSRSRRGAAASAGAAAGRGCARGRRSPGRGSSPCPGGRPVPIQPTSLGIVRWSVSSPSRGSPRAIRSASKAHSPQAGPAASAYAVEPVARDELVAAYGRRRGRTPGDGELGGHVGDLDPHHEPHPVEELDQRRGLAGLGVGGERLAVVDAVRTRARRGPAG